MESAEDDPVGFASLRSGSGYFERIANQACCADGARGAGGGAVGTSADNHYHLHRDPLYGRPERLRERTTNHHDPGYSPLLSDTAPFDVEALITALNDGGDPDPPAQHHKYGDGVHHAGNVTTHHYGDDCPGGHYDDQPTALRVHNEYLDIVGNDDDNDPDCYRPGCCGNDDDGGAK